MSIEDRLRDALGEYRSQMSVSPDLLDRIEEQTNQRSRTPVLLSIAAAIVVTVLVASAILLSGGTDGARVASNDVNRKTFLAAADQLCVRTNEDLREINVVFGTPTALAVASQQGIELARTALRRLEDLRAPRTGRTALGNARRAALDAIVAATAAKEAADDGDVGRADRSLRDFRGAMDGIGVELAAAGAKKCGPGKGAS